MVDISCVAIVNGIYRLHIKKWGFHLGNADLTNPKFADSA